MTTYTAEEVEINKRLTVAALRVADESKRLMGEAVEDRSSEDNAKAGPMCACAIAAMAIGIPLLVASDSLSGSGKIWYGFNYRGVEQALGMGEGVVSNPLIKYNDEQTLPLSAQREIGEDYPPKYTWAEMADIMTAEWNL